MCWSQGEDNLGKTCDPPQTPTSPLARNESSGIHHSSATGFNRHRYGMVVVQGPGSVGPQLRPFAWSIRRGDEDQGYAGSLGGDAGHKADMRVACRYVSEMRGKILHWAGWVGAVVTIFAALAAISGVETG